MQGMSIPTKDSVSPEDSSKNGTEDSPDSLERMLHKSSGEMTCASSVDGSNRVKNYLTLSYLMWENNSNICWLDASMSLLIHNKSVRRLVDSNESSLVSRNIKMFDEAVTLLNDDDHPKDIHLRVVDAKGILKRIQDDTLRYLQPLVKFKEGEPDSAFCSLLNLITEDKSTRALFEVDYAMVLHCAGCQYRKARRHKKPTITLTKVETFDPRSPTCVGACPNCKAPGLVRKLSYRSLPQSLVFHFESGAGKGEFSTLDFSLGERQYRLTGLMVLEKCQEDDTLNHFVTWIRDPLTDSWLECNDLNSEIVTFSVVSPFIQLEDVCIAMYEALDSKGTLPFGSEASEEDLKDPVSKGEADIPFIDLSDDEGQGKDDGADGSKKKGSKVTSCKVQKADLDAGGDSIEHGFGQVLKSSKEPESAEPKVKVGEEELLNECEGKKEVGLSQETKDASKSPIKNRVSSPRGRRKTSELKMQSEGDKYLLGEDLKYKKLMEKIQETKSRSSCRKEAQSESSASEDSPRKKLRSEKNLCKTEKSLYKSDSAGSYCRGDVNPPETELIASPTVSTRRNRNSKQLGETEVASADASDMKEESKENLNNGIQGGNTSSLSVKAGSSEASKLSSISYSKVGTNEAPVFFPKSRRKPPVMPLLRRSCRTRKFTPKVIESLRQSEEEKDSDLSAPACKRRGRPPNSFKSPQRKQDKVDRKVLGGSPRGGGPADKVTKIFNPKEWDVVRIDRPVPGFITCNQFTVFPKSNAKAPAKSYSEEVSGYLDLTLQEFKDKVKSEGDSPSRNFQNGIGATLTLEKRNNSSGSKTIGNSSSGKPKVSSALNPVASPKTIRRDELPHKGSSNSESRTFSKIKLAGDAMPSSHVQGSIPPVENGFSTDSGEISTPKSDAIDVSPILQTDCRDTVKGSSGESKDCTKVISDSFDPKGSDAPLRAKRKVKSDYSPKRKKARSDSNCVSVEDSIRSTVKNCFNFACHFFQVNQSFFGKKNG